MLVNPVIILVVRYGNTIFGDLLRNFSMGFHKAFEFYSSNFNTSRMVYSLIGQVLSGILQFNEYHITFMLLLMYKMLTSKAQVMDEIV